MLKAGKQRVKTGVKTRGSASRYDLAQMSQEWHQNIGCIRIIKDKALLYDF
jgi:hypothetical protein